MAVLEYLFTILEKNYWVVILLMLALALMEKSLYLLLIADVPAAVRLHCELNNVSYWWCVVWYALGWI